MIPRKIEFHPGAESDIEAAFAWYYERSEPAAKRFLREVDAALAQIAKSPELSPPYVAGTRRYLLKRFPFLIIFREPSPNAIQVVALAHGRRRPSYWVDRS